MLGPAATTSWSGAMSKVRATAPPLRAPQARADLRPGREPARGAGEPMPNPGIAALPQARAGSASRIPPRVPRRYSSTPRGRRRAGPRRPRRRPRMGPRAPQTATPARRSSRYPPVRCAPRRTADPSCCHRRGVNRRRAARPASAGRQSTPRGPAPPTGTVSPCGSQSGRGTDRARRAVVETRRHVPAGIARKDAHIARGVADPEPDRPLLVEDRLP